MSKLNVDIVYLIFEELKYDSNTLYSCLTVDKVWCKLIIPILWKNPWKYLKQKTKPLLDVIISHLSNETKENLRSQGISLPQQKPSLNYISFCRHLDVCTLEKIISDNMKIVASKKSIIKNEIFNLFINENTKFTHLYIPQQFDFQIHLIPGAKRCFSEIKFLHCKARINNNVLDGLTELCKSIRGLEIFIDYHRNHEIVRLIENSKELCNVQIHYRSGDKSFCRILENSLIKHANTIQYFKITKQPVTNILSSFVNLKILELDDSLRGMKWKCLENLSLPFLNVLRAKAIPVKVLANLIENTKGHLTEIKIDFVRHDEVNNKRIIQAIYQNCPNLQYLKLLLRNGNILELEKLLISCQYLDGLYIMINRLRDEFDWDKLFEILIKSSPTGLFKFKFVSVRTLKLESLKLFFDNWKGKHPMLLQLFRIDCMEEFSYLIEQYKAEGIVKKYDYDYSFDDFEWIQKRY